METPQSELQAIRQLLAELTNRVYRIEQRLEGSTPSAAEARSPSSGREPSSPPVPVPPAVPTSRLPPPAPYPLIPPASIASTLKPQPDLEARIGSHWLNRIGIAALLIGVSYFLKYAFESNLIGPAAQIFIGIVVGAAMIVWSEWFRLRGYRTFSYSLKAVGIGALYLSLWAAVQIYSLVSVGVAFSGMVVVTAATATFALLQNAEILAAFALAGGFATPVLLATGHNREVQLFAYL